MNKALTKTPYGYTYRGVAITKERSGFSYGYRIENSFRPLNPISHGRSLPDSLKNTLAKIDTELLNNSVENYKIIKKG